jgi:hypothetical protein
MKKMYIKPQAVNVAFSANENIAISLGARIPGVFTIQMTEVTVGKCQKYMSGNPDLYLGLEDDEAAHFGEVMEFTYGEFDWNTFVTILNDDTHKLYNEYVVCVVDRQG